VLSVIETGFNTNSGILPTNDDGSSAQAVPLGFGVDFFGDPRNLTNAVWVNNNGNITFDSSLSAYTPTPLASTGFRIIAPLWADVDTRIGFGAVSYGQRDVPQPDGTVQHQWAATWTNVG
jgi:hypothetical protein